MRYFRIKRRLRFWGMNGWPLSRLMKVFKNFMLKEPFALYFVWGIVAQRVFSFRHEASHTFKNLSFVLF